MGQDSDRHIDKARRKATTLLQHGCLFSEFGSRRRRDYHTQDLVIQGLCQAAEEGGKAGWSGRLIGTSNVHFAMKHGLMPVGTVAHEWFMGVAAITDNYESGNELALRYWVGCFGYGVGSPRWPPERSSDSDMGLPGPWNSSYGYLRYGNLSEGISASCTNLHLSCDGHVSNVSLGCSTIKHGSHREPGDHRAADTCLA